MKKTYTTIFSMATLAMGLNAQINAEPLAVHVNPMQSSGGPNCIVANAAAAPVTGYPAWGDTSSIFIWFDIAGNPGCGMQYPYDLAQVDVNIATPFAFTQAAGDGTGTLTYQVNIYDAITPGDGCTGPGNLIATSGNVVAVYNDENNNIENVLFTETLNNAFFVEWAFVSWTGPGPEVPTVLWDDQPRPLCRQIFTFDDGVSYFDHTNVFDDLGWVDMAIQGTGVVPVAPVNDDCAGAVELTPTVICNPTDGTTVGATESMLPLLCNNYTAPQAIDVWYSFVATEIEHTITVSGSGGYDGVLEFFEGTCAGLVSIDCSDATLADGVEALTATGLNIGTTYYYRTYDWYNTGTEFTTCVTVVSDPPPNDDCSGAIAQNLNEGGSVIFNGDNTGATDDGQGLETPQTWEAFTTTECLDITIEYCGSASVFQSGFVSIFDGCPFTDFVQTPPPPDGYNSTNCVDGNPTFYFYGVPAGTWYYPVLSEAGSMGPYTLTVSGVTCLPPPANDECAGAISLTANATCVTTAANTLTATESMPALECNGFESDVANDVWFSFMATSVEHDIVVTGLDEFDAILELFEGTCAGLVSMSCSDTSLAAGTESITATGLTTGNTYYFRVYSWAGVDSELEVCVVGDNTIGMEDLGVVAFSIFPNPATGFVIIRNGGQSVNANIELLDMSGKVVLTETRVLAGDHKLDITSVAPGMYMLNMYNEDGLNAHHRVMIK